MEQSGTGRIIAPVRIVLFVFLLWLAGPASACVKTLRWSDDGPYSKRLPDGRIVGAMVDIHVELLRRMGCRAELVEMPFARALAELRSGHLDLLPGSFDRPERREYAHFSRPMLLSRNLLYVREADLPKARGLSLAELVAQDWQVGVQIDVVYGPSYVELLKDAQASAKLQRIGKRANLWQMLARHRVDAVPASESSAQQELAELGLQAQIVPSGLVLSEEAVGTAISRLRNDEAFVARFNATLERMRADGSYAALMGRYGLKPDRMPPR